MNIRSTPYIPKRAAGSTPRHSAAHISSVDQVSLSQAQPSPIYRPAAHLNRADAEYSKLVPTHPSDSEEFSHGVESIKAIVAEVMYGGRWPEDSELPNLGSPAKPGEPARNGGQTRSEQLVANDLIDIYREVSPHVKTTEQHKRLASSIHICQSGLQSRVLRRDYPDYYFSLPGSLDKDAQREAGRWG
jgi:hypothetical protein